MDMATGLNVSIFDLGNVKQGINLTPIPGGVLAEIPDNLITDKKGEEEK